nr:unnamed protein product [Callosobruchus analis]
MSDTAIITLKTDKFVSGKGFKLMYRSEACGGEITNETDIDYISDMNIVRINMRLPASHGCTWNITAPPKQVVVLSNSFKRRRSLARNTNYWMPIPSCTIMVCTYEFGYFFLISQSNNPWRKIQQLGLASEYKNQQAPIGNWLNHLFGLTFLPSAEVGESFAQDFMSDKPQDSKVDQFTDYLVDTYIDKNSCSIFRTTNTCESFHSKFKKENLSPYPNIHSFLMAGSTGCISNLQVFNSLKAVQENRLGRFCGDINTEITINSVNNTMSVLLMTHPRKLIVPGSSLHQKITKLWLTSLIQGFLCPATFPMIRDGGSPLADLIERICKMQQISSSPLTKTWPSFVKCYYNFFYNKGGATSIHLHFVEFDLSDEHIPDNLQYITQCHGDTIEIIEDHDVGGPGSGLLSPDYIFRGHRKSAPTSFITAWGFLDFKGRHVFCGKDDKPFDYYTSSTSVALFFDGTKGKNKGKGFKLEYSLAGCNRNYTELQGRISNGYNNTECLVSIAVPENRTISLYFNLLTLKEDCHYFQIRDGSPTGTLLMKVCGYAVPDPVFSYTNKVFIHIYSRTLPQTLGMKYDVSYTSTDKGRGCGGTLYGNKGKVYSPLYPHPFRNETTCTWTIRVPVGLHAVLKLMVTGKARSTILCPTDDTDVFKSESYIIISYTSYAQNDGKGWEAFYQAVPNGKLLLLTVKRK